MKFKQLPDKVWIDTDLKAFVQKGLSGTILMEILARVFLFVITILLTNWLPLEDYGRYSFFIASIISIATIGTLGLDDLLVRKIGSKESTSSFISLLGISIVATSILVIIWFYINDPQENNIKFYLIISAILLAVVYMTSALLKGYKHVLSAQIPEQIIRPFFVLIGLGLLWVIYNNFDLLNVVKVVFASIFISIVFSLILLWRKGLLGHLGFLKWSEFRWSWDIFFFAALTLFGVLRHKLDILILGYFDFYSSTAIYNVASKLSDFLLVGLILTNAVYMPLFATQKGAPDNKKLTKILESSLLINLMIGSLFFLVFLLFGPWILELFGLSYVEGYTALVILSSSTWIYALIGPYVIMLMMIGLERQVLFGLVLGILVQIFLCIFLLQNDPVIGMAIAKGAAIIVIQMYMLFVAWNKLQLRPVFLRWILK